MGQGKRTRSDRDPSRHLRPPVRGRGRSSGRAFGPRGAWTGKLGGVSGVERSPPVADSDRIDVARGSGGACLGARFASCPPPQRRTGQLWPRRAAAALGVREAIRWSILFGPCTGTSRLAGLGPIRVDPLTQLETPMPKCGPMSKSSPASLRSARTPWLLAPGLPTGPAGRLSPSSHGHRSRPWRWPEPHRGSGRSSHPDPAMVKVHGHSAPGSRP